MDSANIPSPHLSCRPTYFFSKSNPNNRNVSAERTCPPPTILSFVQNQECSAARKMHVNIIEIAKSSLCAHCNSIIYPHTRNYKLCRHCRDDDVKAQIMASKIANTTLANSPQPKRKTTDNEAQQPNKASKTVNKMSIDFLVN